MHTITDDTLEILDLGQSISAAMLVVAGLLLLGVGVMITGWEPIELSLGLLSLGVAVVAMMKPNCWRGEDGLERVNSLVLASLITLTGFILWTEISF